MIKIINAFEVFRGAVRMPKQRLPRILQFPVNNICNSRCQMCNVWKMKNQYEMTPDDIRKVLANPLFREISWVGVSGGEPTLRKDLKEVYEAIVDVLPKVNGLTLITNALAYKRVIDAVRDVGTICRERRLHSQIIVSLDGIGEVHDKVRGVRGAFESASKVIEYVEESSVVDSYSVACTVIKENVFDVENVLEWCKNRDIHVNFQLGIPHKRLYMDDHPEPFDLSFVEKYHFSVFLDSLFLSYEESEIKKAYYKSLRDQIMYNRPKSSGCDFKNRGVTLYPNGELSYCAVASKTIGNALEKDAEELYWDHSSHLKEIIEHRCQDCLHGYQGVADRKILYKMALKKVYCKLPALLQRGAVSASKTLSQFKEARRIRRVLRKIRTDMGKSQPRQKRILICGWYGTETLGDKAIVGGVVMSMRNHVNDWKIDIASIEPYVTKMTLYQMPELEIDNVLGLAEAKKAVADGMYSYVVIGGGPLMSSIGYCTDLLELFVLAKNIGAKTIIGGCGIGPITDSPINKSIESLLNIADLVVLRDTSSAELAHTKFNCARPIQSIVDPAFIWIKHELPDDLERNEKQIILALRDWPVEEFNDSVRPDKKIRMKSHFEKELLNFINELKVVEPEVEIIPFCMHKLPVGGDDRVFYRRIFSEHSDILKNLDNLHRSPIDDLKVIARSRAILAMRFHSVVFSLATKTPFLAIDYSLGGKIRGLLKDLKAEDNLVEIKNFNGKEICRLLWNQHYNVSDIDETIMRTEKLLSDMFSQTPDE